MEHRYEIFISYRRDGGAERAELLKLLFEKHGYTPDQIFMDTHSIDSCNFKQRIKEAIFQAKYFVLVVCEGNFDKVKPEDYWIFEIEEAMSLQKQIIPVFFDGIGGIDSGKLPVNIKPLAQIQGIIYHHQYSDAFYAKLLSFINPPHLSIDDKDNNKKMLSIISIIAILIIISLIMFGVFSFLQPHNDISGSDSTQSPAITVSKETREKGEQNQDKSRIKVQKDENGYIVQFENGKENRYGKNEFHEILTEALQKVLSDKYLENIFANKNIVYKIKDKDFTLDIGRGNNNPTFSYQYIKLKEYLEGRG